MTYTPLKMAPCYKEYIWGGTRLKTEYGKSDAPEVTAESWELACHKDGCSIVAEGPLKGKSLNDLAALDRTGFWGQDCAAGKFPILVKLIDAAKDLSVQVHPSDATALYEKGEQGKTEMWYVIDCQPQAFLYLGFSQGLDREELLARAKDGTICQSLNRVSVHRGDVFYILPGTVHALGAGTVIAEIQQNSNTTFRVYDYHRRRPDGKERPLHLERASEVMNYEPIVPQECRANSGVTFPDFTIAEMFSCQYCRAYRLDVRKQIKLQCGGSSFQHLLCVDGMGEIICNGKENPFARGTSYFLPAALGEYTIKGESRMLLSTL